MNKFLLRSITAAATLALGSITAFGQWPSYPTGVPKGPDGKPDLNAPAPRTPDGHPDLSGTWEVGRGGGGGGGRGGRGGRGGPGAGGPLAGGPPPGGPAPGGPPPAGLGGPPPGGGPPGAGGARPRPVLPPDGIPNATFGDIGAGFPDGLPLKPWAVDLLAKRKSENSKDNPDAHCLPLGLMQLHEHPQPRKIIQTPNLIVILYEAQAGMRQIFMDGRSLPGPDAFPWWYGYSIGHWDGDTLVVETNGFRDDVWLDVNGSPLTNTGKMIERFRRVNYGTMQIDVTIDDPKAYTKPFTVRVNHRLMPDADLIEFICNENEKSDAHLVGK